MAGKGKRIGKNVSTPEYRDGHDNVNWPEKECKCGHTKGGDCEGCPNLKDKNGRETNKRVQGSHLEPEARK